MIVILNLELSGRVTKKTSVRMATLVERDRLLPLHHI